MNNHDQADREKVRKVAIARARKACRVVEFSEIIAKEGNQQWPVKIKARADEYFYISGRGSGLDVYITETNAGYLVSVSNYNRCGHVPANCNRYDIQEYLDLENAADALTLATAINFIINSGLVSNHPEIQNGERKNPSI